jgi:hypothetical protein
MQYKYEVASRNAKRKIELVEIKVKSADYADIDGLLVTMYTSHPAKFYHQGDSSRLGFIKL